MSEPKPHRVVGDDWRTGPLDEPLEDRTAGLADGHLHRGGEKAPDQSPEPYKATT